MSNSPTKKPPQTLESKARELIANAQAATARHNPASYDEFVYAYLLGTLHNAELRAVTCEALKLRFEMTEEDIGLYLVGA